MPLRLPPKPKKGKQKQINIDYTSPETVRTSAPSDWQPDDFLAEGTRQEEQGERYQSGPKAQRHTHNAVTCYRLAASLSPSTSSSSAVSTSFDARYNVARALQTLATEHLAPPVCLETLQQAIEWYREALAVLGEGEGETARIDGLFNLAQAHVELHEMLEEGAAAVNEEGTHALQAANEALSLFMEVERRQRIAMEQVFGSDGPQQSLEGTGSEDTDDAASIAGSATEVQATETTVVTPQLIVDTLLALIAFTLTLVSSNTTESSATGSLNQTTLRTSAVSALSRATSLRTQIPHASAGQPDDLDIELASVQGSVLAICSPASTEATSFLHSTLTSLSSPRAELLSLFGDNLLDSLPLSKPLPELLSTLQHALQVYQQASSLLSNRLSPPKNTPSARLPSLLSANLAAQATVHLLTYTIASRALTLDSSLSASFPQQQLADHLEQAHQLSLDSIGAAKSGISLAISNTSPPGALKPTLALVRAPPSQDLRNDWRTLSAVRAALFTLVRVRLRFDRSEEAWQAEKKQFGALWRAVGLNRSGGTVGSAEEQRLRAREIRWWSEESAEDKISEATEEGERAREWSWWHSLAA
ncbi:hypothetical protein JCM11641_004187 [Rhodosporidiobolus odoratus]